MTWNPTYRTRGGERELLKVETNELKAKAPACGDNRSFYHAISIFSVRLFEFCTFSVYVGYPIIMPF